MRQEQLPGRFRIGARRLALGLVTGAVALSLTGAPAKAAVVAHDTTDVERAVVDLTNAARGVGRNCGETYFPAAAPLTLNETLGDVALAHSTDMGVRGFFSHDNPDGVGPFQRMSTAGYQYTAAGENIAAGYATPQEVVAGWLESPGHCRNVMNPSFTEIGVGFYLSDTLYHEYWSQEFGARGVDWSASPAPDDDGTAATASATQAIAAAQPAAVVPALRVTVVKRTSAKVAWGALAGASGYRVRIVRPSGPGAWVTTSGTSRHFTGLKRHRQFSVEVVPVLASGSAAAASVTFTTK